MIAAEAAGFQFGSGASCGGGAPPPYKATPGAASPGVVVTPVQGVVLDLCYWTDATWAWSSMWPPSFAETMSSGISPSTIATFSLWPSRLIM